MKHLVHTLVAAATLALAPLAACEAAGTIRVAVQKTGTFAWELAVIRAHGLDRQGDLAIDVTELATPEAGKIALRAGNADIMVSDWLWVSRERELGARLAFYPYSSALGAVMVQASSPIRSLADLKGRKLAVAGGPIDKSWLLLQAAARQDGIDLKSEAAVVYGAPPLLAAKRLCCQQGRRTINDVRFRLQVGPVLLQRGLQQQPAFVDGSARDRELATPEIGQSSYRRCTRHHHGAERARIGVESEPCADVAFAGNP